MSNRDFHDAMSSMPIIASLRGLQPDAALDVGHILAENGVTVLEVIIRGKDSLFSPPESAALRTISSLITNYGPRAHIAAGTVTRADDITKLRDLGVTTCLAPNFIPKVVAEAARLNMSFVPGIETASEAMLAVAEGAAGVKLFPCIFYEPNGSLTVRHSPGYVRYLTGFLPIPIYPSGDFGWDNMTMEYISAGANGVNIGRHLYKADISPEQLAKNAMYFTTLLKTRELTS